MANFIKKLISGISVAAILAATAVYPVMAEEVYESWDYSAADATADWTLGDNTTQSITDGMLYIVNGSTSGTRVSSKTLENPVTEGDMVVEYAIKSYSRGDNASTFFIGESSTDYIIDLKFPKGGSSMTVNGETVSLTGASDYNTPIVVVKHSILTGSNIVKTEIKYEDGTPVHSGSTSYSMSNATDSIKTMVASLGKYNAFYLKYFTVSEYIPTDDEKLAIAMNQITITENQLGMTVEDGVYTVDRDIALPAQPADVTLEWVLEQSEDGESWEETSYASVSNDKLVIAPTEDSVNYLVRLTANVTCGELSESKSFMFRIMAPDPNAPVVYYNESFEGFPTGTLVDFNTSSNVLYEAVSGMTFSCGTRDGDNGVTGASIAGSTDKYLNLFQTKHTGQSRQPVVTLSRTNGVEFVNNLVIKFNATFANTSVTLNITDSSNNVLKIAAPSEAVLNTWISIEICKQGGVTVVVMRDESENILKVYTDKVKLSDVKTISTPDTTYSLLYIDDLYISDEPYSVSDETIAGAGIAALALDVAQTNLAANGDEFDAKGDFLVPESPELTTLTWAVEQKAVDSDVWEASNFMSVSDTKVTINPTAEIGNYKTRLVATVICGEVTETKEFVINLPNPLDEIADVLASGYEVVSSTDYTDATNTTKLTYDLDGEETLKFDLVLPTKVSSYKNCTIAWTSSDEDYVSIQNGVATIMTDDLEEHDVTLTAVVTYKKGNVELSSEPQSFDIKVGYTEEDIEDTETYYKGKYKVRFDAEYDGNFEDIPEETTSNIDLPTEGKFGSRISWSSSAPSVISTKGKVSRAATNKTVNLTATITSGAGSAEKTFEIEVPKKSSSGGGGGGGSTSSTGTISNSGNSGSIASGNVIGTVGNSSAEEIVSQLQEEAAVAKDLFSDLSSAAWAREAINGLAAAGVVNGKSDTEFAPNDTVTRAEFAKMLMGVFGLSSGAYRTSSFNDVSTSAWYFNSVETAYNLGIITGVGGGKFAPDALITRQDMAVMVVRAANISGVALSEVEAQISFADEASIADYAKAPVSTLQKANIINGVSDTEFAPVDNATRAQAAQILYNVLSLVG